MSSRGFTLLEVLVAMAIFSIIGLGAQQMLQMVIKSHERTQERTQAFDRLTRGITRMQRDFLQAVPRPVRDEYGEALPPVMAGHTGPYLVEITRTGWNNPLGRNRSHLQRVAYDMVDGEVRRHFWLVLDRAEDSQPITQTLFGGVDDLRINFIGREGDRTDVWPQLEMESSLPEAVEIVIASRRYGELRRTIIFPANPAVGQPDGMDNGEGADFDTDAESDAEAGADNEQP
ncbi:MAG: type II secretion system minor pseudopilin GspJ [Pseudomonadales bacterium]